MAYLGRPGATAPLTSADIPDGSITSAKIVDGTVTASDLADNYDDKIQTNIALLAFKTASNGSLAKYNLQDQVIDEYTDATGVDASASTNESLASGAYSATSSNYFGDGSDGAFTSDGSDTQTVPNKVGSYDGDMLLKQYTSFTVSSGHTYTTDQPGRGMLIYVSGDCTIAGTLTMTGRGGSANPTSSTASSDGNVVNASGLQLGMFTSGSSSHTNALTSFDGFGTAVRTAFNNQPDPSSNGTVYTITRTGGAGVGESGSGNKHGTTGTAGTLSGTSMGTGAGGAGGVGSVTSGTGPVSGAGGAFGGGSGSHGVRISGAFSGTSQVYGNAGETATSSGSCASGGTGNPGGAGVNGGDTGTSGTGGILILIVGGNLTITGTVSANGVANNVSSNCAIGGSSGGGAVLLLYGGTLANSGTVQALGGAASTASAFGNGGAGGAGTTQIAQLGGIQNLTLQSIDTEAEAQPTKADMVMLIEDAGSGVGTVNTHIKGFISRDSGTTFTEGTLVDEGDWGDDRRILAFHDLDISGQPADQTMCYKITTHSSSAVYNTKIHATSMGWR